jgi:excisionase family DNA binding protein
MVNIVIYFLNFRLDVSWGIVIFPCMSKISIPRLLKKKDVAAALSCSVRHVTHLIQTGKLTSISLGAKTVRVTFESVENFISGK